MNLAATSFANLNGKLARAGLPVAAEKKKVVSSNFDLAVQTAALVGGGCKGN